MVEKAFSLRWGKGVRSLGISELITLWKFWVGRKSLKPDQDFDYWLHRIFLDLVQEP